MDIQQFEDKGLAHYSYAIYSENVNEVILIDPSRDLTPYLAYAKSLDARITGVIETHPHADFISGHLELHQTTGAVIYCSQLVGAAYPHTAFDEGDEIVLGDITLRALNTPGHSPDSICIVLTYAGEDRWYLPEIPCLLATVVAPICARALVILPPAGKHWRA